MTQPLVWLLGLIAAGLAVMLYLFLSVKVEIGTLAAKWEKKGKNVDRAIEQLKAQAHEAEEPAGPPAPPPLPRDGFNLTTRSQALRMYRRGEQPGQIAAALRVPENEIRLLLKVHDLKVE